VLVTADSVGRNASQAPSERRNANAVQATATTAVRAAIRAYLAAISLGHQLI